MANTTNFSIRIDSDIKKQCETLYGELGMNLTTAINVFLRQSLRVGGFPFEVKLEQLILFSEQGRRFRGASEWRQAVCRPGSDMPDVPMSPKAENRRATPRVFSCFRLIGMPGISEPGHHTDSLGPTTASTQPNSNMTNLKFRFIRVRPLRTISCAKWQNNGIAV